MIAAAFFLGFCVGCGCVTLAFCTLVADRRNAFVADAPPEACDRPTYWPFGIGQRRVRPSPRTLSFDAIDDGMAAKFLTMDALVKHSPPDPQ